MTPLNVEAVLRTAIGPARRIVPVLVLALVALVALPLHAQVYRWVDADGTVNYSDRPPPDVAAERTSLRSQPTDLEAALRDQVERERRLELAAIERADAAEDAADQAEYEARVARSCEQARERVTTIERARRLSRVDAEGNRSVYDDAERAAALAEANTQVAEWCR